MDGAVLLLNYISHIWLPTYREGRLKRDSAKVMRCRYGTATVAVTIINMEVAAECWPEMAPSFTGHKTRRSVVHSRAGQGRQEEKGRN